MLRETKIQGFFPRIGQTKNATMLVQSIKVDNQMVTDNEQISSHVMEHFQHLFNNGSILMDFILVDEVFPNLVN